MYVRRLQCLSTVYIRLTSDCHRYCAGLYSCLHVIATEHNQSFGDSLRVSVRCNVTALCSVILLLYLSLYLDYIIPQYRCIVHQYNHLLQLISTYYTAISLYISLNRINTLNFKKASKQMCNTRGHVADRSICNAYMYSM